MKPFLIGLAGFSGAGKSTLARHLEMQGGVKRFRFDHYYKDENQCPHTSDGVINWDLPESLHLDQLLEALIDIKSGNDILIPLYDRGQNKRIGQLMYYPSPVIFVEGMQLFAQEKIRDLFDLRLWLEVSEEVALERRLKRQPDYDMVYYKNIALPSARKHVAPMREHAHEIIDGAGTIYEVTSLADSKIHQYLL